QIDGQRVLGVLAELAGAVEAQPQAVLGHDRAEAAVVDLDRLALVERAIVLTAGEVTDHQDLERQLALVLGLVILVDQVDAIADLRGGLLAVHEINLGARLHCYVAMLCSRSAPVWPGRSIAARCCGVSSRPPLAVVSSSSAMIGQI